MLFDQTGKALENVFAQVHYSAETTPDGGSIIDPHALFETVLDSITTVVEQVGERSQHIAVVAMDTLVSSLVGVTERGEPTTPIFTWADTRGGELSDQWRSRLATVGLSPEQYTQTTGCRIHTSY